MATIVDSSIISSENLPSIASPGDLIIRLSDRQSTGQVFDNSEATIQNNGILWIECGDYTGLDFNINGWPENVSVIPYGSGQLRILCIQDAGDYTDGTATENANFVSPDKIPFVFSGQPTTSCNVKFLTMYNEYLGIGDPDYNGWESVTGTESPRGKFRILVDGRFATKITDYTKERAIGTRNDLVKFNWSANAGITLHFQNFEICNGGFSGIADKIDGFGDPEATRNNCIYENGYIHDVMNEANYFGSDPFEESFVGTIYRNVLVCRMGGEDKQHSSMAQGCWIHNNVTFATGLEFESPFQGYQAQDKNYQIKYKTGQIKINKNIVMGSGSSQLITIPDTDSSIFSQTGELIIEDNYFGEGRDKFARINGGDNNIPIVIRNNYIGAYYQEHLDAVLNSSPSTEVIQNGQNDERVSIISNRTDLTGSGRSLVSSAGSNVQVLSNIDEAVERPQFVASGYPDDFDLSRLKLFVEAYIERPDLSGYPGWRTPIQRNVGDIILYNGLHYEVVTQHMSYTTADDYFERLVYYPDGSTKQYTQDGANNYSTLVSTTPGAHSYFEQVFWDANFIPSFDTSYNGTPVYSYPNDNFLLVKDSKYNLLGYGLFSNPINETKTEIRWKKAEDDGSNNPNLLTINNVYELINRYRITRTEMENLIGVGNHFKQIIYKGSEIYESDWTQLT